MTDGHLPLGFVRPLVPARAHRLAPRSATSLTTIAVCLLVAWPGLVLFVDILASRGRVSAAWISGWFALVACCALGAGVISSVEGFDMERLELAAIFALAYPLFVMSGVPAMSEQFSGTVGVQRLTFGTFVGYVFTLLGAALVARLGHGWVAKEGRRSSMLQRCAAAGALASGLALLGYYLVVAGQPPILLAARGTRGIALAKARQDAVVSLTNPLARYGFNFTRLYLLPVASGALIVIWRRRRTLTSAVAAVAVTSVALVAASLTLEKSPVVRLVLIVIVSLMIGTGLRVRLRVLGLIVALIVAFPLIVLSVGNPESSVLSLVKLFGDRIFVDPARTLYHYFQWAPEESNGFLGGRLLPFVGRLAGPEVKVTEIISNRIFPDATVQGNANAAFVGNLWVDFGWWGLTIGAFFTGLAIAVLQRALGTIRNNAVGAAVSALLALQVLFLVQTSVFDAVLSVGLGVVDVAILGFVWVRILANADRRSLPS
jgi:hypothetical protein